MSGRLATGHALTSFVGRKREIREVGELIVESRLVTLTGPGGSGKTRLAMEAVDRLEEHFPDGIVLVQLAAIDDPRLIPEVVAAAMALPEQPGRPLLATISDFLRAKTALVVMDNCEHLVADVASLSDALLQACADLHILATSRVRLGIAGERVLPVPALADAEAMTLFTERAAEARPAFSLTPDNRDTIAEICRRLDGMPLAVELAAARIRMLSVADINQLMDDRFRLLSHGSRTALPRHQSLEATTEWSHELLDSPAQRLWRRLSVFAGGFRLESAQAICSDAALSQPQIFEKLQELIDASVVEVMERSGVRRYRMLETIRAYGTQKLEASGERDRFQRRHLEWFLELARRAEPEWRGAHQVEWLSRLAEDLDNIRAALHYSRQHHDLIDSGLELASALWLLWGNGGHVGEGRQWLASLLELAPPSSAKANALNAAGFMAYLQGDTAPAVPLLQASLELNQKLGQDAAATFALLRLGIALYYNNELIRSIETLDEALVRYRARHDRVGIYVAAYELAEALTMSGDFARAGELHQESLLLKQQQGDLWHLAFSYFGLGLLAWRTADLAGALSQLRESLRYRKEINDWWGIARTLEVMSWVEADRRESVRAVHLMGAAARLMEQGGTTLSRNYRGQHDEVRTRLERLLPSATFKSAFEQRSLSSEQAYQFAMSNSAAPTSPKPVGGVSRREEEIARLVAEGLTNREIARRLTLAERTVDAHLEHIMNKLGFRSRAQIAAWVTTRT